LHCSKGVEVQRAHPVTLDLGARSGLGRGPRYPTNRLGFDAQALMQFRDLNPYRNVNSFAELPKD
jgi:hypothetical protein